jgi:hypothetical protein
MTENLAETSYASGFAGAPAAPTLKNTTTAPGNADRAYTTPGKGAAEGGASGRLTVDQAQSDYYGIGSKPGLLYTFGAANGLADATTETANQYLLNRTDLGYRQGICPDGWHVPSDGEWSGLEKEISLHPSLYSTYSSGFQYEVDANSYNYFNEGSSTASYRPSIAAPAAVNSGSWGNLIQLNKVPNTAVNTTTPATNSNTVASSKSASTGGFAGLQVGLAGSDWDGYGMGALFWSSSSGTYAGGWSRILSSNFSGVYRALYVKSGLLSVRCNKN